MHTPPESVVIPQLWNKSSNATDGGCGAGPGAPIDCRALRELLRDGAWFNENVQEGLHIEDTPGPQCLPADAAAVCVLEAGFLCVLSPGGLQLSNNEDLLHSFGEGRLAERLNLRVRLVYVTQLPHVHLHLQRYAVHAVCHTLQVSRPKAPIVTIGVQNECVRRGLASPLYSSMRLVKSPLGTETCVYECRPDHVRWPWNSDPFPASQAPSLALAQCKPIPETFFAVEFDLRAELHMAHAIPELLTPDFLHTMDRLSSLAEGGIRASNPDIQSVIVLISVLGSVYDTQSFQSVIQECVRFRGVQERYSVKHVGSAQRRTQFTTDIQIKGLFIIEIAYMSPAAIVAYTESAWASVLQDFQPPPSTEIMRIVHTDTSTLHRVALKETPNPPLPPSPGPSMSSHASRVSRGVLFTEQEVTVLALIVFLLDLCYP
jgi:hypothetical protein